MFLISESYLESITFTCEERVMIVAREVIIIWIQWLVNADKQLISLQGYSKIAYLSYSGD